ncbi:Centrosomal protein of 162 kDa, partial [Manis javanica]
HRSSLSLAWFGVALICKKLADRKETEFVSPSPLNMNPNVISQEPQIGNQFFDKTQENVVLQMTTNKCIESSCPRVNTMEEHIDKMYLDILKKKISVGPTLLPQDDKLNKTYRSQLSSGEEEAVTGKQVPYKETGSALPLLKRKPQSALYASLRSSGYGKPSSPFKTFSTLEKKTSKDMKSKNLRSIPTSNQTRKKEILSGTKLLKPAASGRPAPQTQSCLTPEKSAHPAETGSCVQSRNDSSGCHGGIKETELIMFKRKRRELENKMEELNRQQEKELFKLNQDNYILQAKRWLHFEETTEEKLKQIQKEIQEQETLLQGYQQ